MRIRGDGGRALGNRRANKRRQGWPQGERELATRWRNSVERETIVGR